MKIYVAHSRKFDYLNELYKPIRSNINNHEIILPHESEVFEKHDREYYRNIDLFIADVSYPATGLGIELGFAYDDNKPIYCICKKGNKYCSSIKSITDKIYEYNDMDEMISIIKGLVD